jgi:DNA-binding NarL/FixJ family response regulator
MESASDRQVLVYRTTPRPRPAALRVCVVAADPLLRAGTVASLRSWADTEVIGEEAVSDGAVVILVADTFDDALDHRLLDLRRTARVVGVLVTTELDDAALARAVVCGVRAVVWRREATNDALRRAVVAVAEGGGSLPPDLTGMLMARFRRSQLRPGDGVDRRKLLSPRELDVLRLVAEGCDTNEIAHQLAYSERTIKTILHDVTTRLHLRNRSHAVAFLIRRGLL